MPGKADKGTGTGRGRPRGPRAPSARDLAHTPEITQYYGPEQPPLAPILQQDTGEVQLMSGASSRRLTQMPVLMTSLRTLLHLGMW